MIGILLAFWAAFGLALMSPGPNFAVMLGTAPRQGRGTAILLALGIAVGEAAWGFAAVFGVAALAAQHPAVAWALRLGGGLFLLWLAAQALRAALTRKPAAPEATPDIAAPPSTLGGLARGFLLMLLNAKAGVFWVSLAGLFLGHGTSAATGVAAVAGAVVLSLAWHLTLAFAFSAGPVVAAYRRVQRAIEGALGVLLGGIGIRILLLG
jgi:threonine/homoserine/homoserine lactone efflux protein